MVYKKLGTRTCGKNLLEKAIQEGITIAGDMGVEDYYSEFLYPTYPYVRKTYSIDLPKRYIINKGATILFWEDGSKTIVKRCKEDKYNKRLGFLTAYFQKHCGMSKNKANKYLASLEEEE